MDFDLDIGKMHYSFTQIPKFKDSHISHFKVPCMSTCGMMIEKRLMKDIEMWPKQMGIYGGGENFLNFVLATIGKQINVFTSEPLRHHGDKRGYSQNYNDTLKNRMIACYMVGGNELAKRYADFVDGDPQIIDRIYDDVIHECVSQRHHIRKQQVISIQEWYKLWRKWKPGF